jgi:hypothetical protein
MDHVPTPTDPYHPPLLVPYLADGNPGLAYDGKGFLSFPERQGIDPQALTMGDFQNRTHADLLCFFQSWCFFGLLIEVLGVAGISVTVEDFIRIETDNIESKGQVFVSADKLPWLIREWEKGGRDLTEYQKTDRYALIYKHVRDVAQFVCVSSQYAIDVDGRHFFSDSTAQWEDGPSIGNVVQLSIMILWNYLGCAAVTFYKPKAVNYDVPIGQSAYLKKRMVQAGWCPHEVSSLCDQLVGTACLYYLSSFNRHSLVQNHGSCVTSSHCIYAKLDLETYKTKHATECTSTSLS